MFLYWRLLALLKIIKPGGKWGECPLCGFDKFEMYADPYFKATGGGSYSPGANPRVYWFEGIQTCPRCLHKWHVQDSN